MSERISALPVASLRERHSGEVLLFSEARITHDGHRARGVSQLAGHGDPLLRATSWPKPSRTNDSLNFIALTPLPVAPSRFFNSSRFYFVSRNSSRFFPVAFAACSCRRTPFSFLTDVCLSCTWTFKFFTRNFLDVLYIKRYIFDVKYFWCKIF